MALLHRIALPLGAAAGPSLSRALLLRRNEAAAAGPEAEAPARVLLAANASDEKELRKKCHALTPVDIASCTETQAKVKRLIATLEQFRSTHGFGRAIAAPQIGVPLRIIAFHLSEDVNRKVSGSAGPFAVYNPELTWHSDETFTMWDDCMSFPDLLFKVVTRTWEKMPRTFAELVQHEMDHLDGVLMCDRAVEGSQPVRRTDYDLDRAKYDALVDYTIVPTTGEFIT